LLWLKTMQTMLTFLAVLLIDFTMFLRAGFNVCNNLFSTSTIGWVQQGSILLYKKKDQYSLGSTLTVFCLSPKTFAGTSYWPCQFNFNL
jgi:uncharacterized membrane protein